MGKSCKEIAKSLVDCVNKTGETINNINIYTYTYTSTTTRMYEKWR